MQYDRVVITGMGLITPIGNTVKDFWQNLINGKSGCDFITRFDASKYKTRFACEIKDFNPDLYFDKKEARRLDRNCQIAIAASNEAMNDAGLIKDNYDPDRIGVIVGSGIGGFESFQEECIHYALNSRTPRFSPFFIPKIITDMAAGVISMQHNLRGPNFAVVSACATSNNAMIEGLYHLRLNKADIMLCGGTEMGICEGALGGFSSMKALSERNDDPAKASRPYDKDRDGFVIGEGAGILILERLDSALKRGATIYCELAGAGASGDAYHMTAPHPEGLGAKRSMISALEDANMQPSDIDYINTHGTSTPLGDVAEIKAIKDVFGDHIYNVNISSTKSMTGHCLGAAGAVEGVACIKAILEGIIPPTINHENDDPELDSKINFTFNVAQKRKVKAALSNSFGFGGHNSTIIFKEYIA